MPRARLLVFVCNIAHWMFAIPWDQVLLGSHFRALSSSREEVSPTLNYVGSQRVWPRGQDNCAVLRQKNREPAGQSLTLPSCPMPARNKSRIGKSRAITLDLWEVP